MKNPPTLPGTLLQFLWGLFLFSIYATGITAFIWSVGHLLLALLSVPIPIMSPESFLLSILSSGASVKITMGVWGRM